MKYKGKDVLDFGWNVNIMEKNDPSIMWRRSYSRYKNSGLLLCDIDTFKEKQKSLKTDLKPNTTLYFGKSSGFPRFKLADSGFKRCIKIDKADFVVLGKIALDQYNDQYYILEDEQFVYMLPFAAYNRLHYRTPQTEARDFAQDPIAYIKRNHFYYGKNLTLIYKGKICRCEGEEDALKIMDGTYKNLVSDEEVDLMVNSKNDALDAGTLESVCELLDSPDRESMALGLKLLIGFNVNATPLTIRTTLSLRPKLAELSEWTSVGVKQVLETVKFRGFAQFPDRLGNAISSKDEFDSYTEEDKNLCKEVYKSAIIAHMKNAYNKAINTGIPKIFGFKINYSVED